MANEPVKTWQETFGGLWRAGEQGYAAASQVGGVAMTGGVAAGATAMAGAGYLASGTASGVKTVYNAAEAHPKTAAAIGGGTLAVVAAPVETDKKGSKKKGGKACDRTARCV